MGFNEKIVVGKISVKVMHSGKIMLDCTCSCAKKDGIYPKNLFGNYLQEEKLLHSSEAKVTTGNKNQKY